MTFEPWKGNSTLIRFEHILEKNEDAELSKPVTIDLTKIFRGTFEYSELTLAANQFIGDNNRLRFKSAGVETIKKLLNDLESRVLTSPEITLGPMEIRTFLMTPIEGEPNGSITLQIFKLFPLLTIALIAKAFLKR